MSNSNHLSWYTLQINFFLAYYLTFFSDYGILQCKSFFFSEVMVFGLSVSTKINSSMLYLSTESTSSKFSNHLLNYAMMFLMILKKIFCFDGYFHQSILIVYLHFSLFFFFLIKLARGLSILLTFKYQDFFVY